MLLILVIWYHPQSMGHYFLFKGHERIVRLFTDTVTAFTLKTVAEASIILVRLKPLNLIAANLEISLRLMNLRDKISSSSPSSLYTWHR